MVVGGSRQVLKVTGRWADKVVYELLLGICTCLSVLPSACMYKMLVKVKPSSVQYVASLFWWE